MSSGGWLSLRECKRVQCLSGGARECQRSNGSVRAWVDNGTNVTFAVSDNDFV